MPFSWLIYRGNFFLTLKKTKIEEIIMQKKRFRQRAARNRFTINNPFLTDDIRVLAPDNLTEEQKGLLGKVSHDYAYLKQPQYDGLFVFAIVEYDLKDNNQITGKAVAERAFFKDYQSACEYFKSIEFIDYVCFQYEQGASGNKHLQGFMHYNRQIDFSMVKTIFPTIHLDACTESNYYYRAYCCKQDTKIEGYDFFEHGVLVEERQRTDTAQFAQDVLDVNIPITELFIKYPTLTMHGLPKIKALRQEKLEEHFGNVTRDVHVTYIYGKSRAGKTTYPKRVLGYTPKQIAKVGKYNSTGQFDQYNMQDIIVFDEFKGQIPLTEMNDYIEGEPLNLSARNTNRVACYTKVFIISNYPLSEQYKKARRDGDEPSYEAFCNRIHEIIYMPERNSYIWQKGTPTDEITAKLTEQGARYMVHEVQEPQKQQDTLC